MFYITCECREMEALFWWVFCCLFCFDVCELMLVLVKSDMDLFHFDNFFFLFFSFSFFFLSSCFIFVCLLSILLWNDNACVCVTMWFMNCAIEWAGMSTCCCNCKLIDVCIQVMLIWKQHYIFVWFMSQTVVWLMIATSCNLSLVVLCCSSVLFLMEWVGCFHRR